MPVLTVLAMEVAANTAQRVRECAGKVMEKGFFFDRVNGLGTDLAVCGGIQSAILVQPNTTDPVAAILDSAAVITERAFHRVVFTFCVLARFVHVNPHPTGTNRSLKFFVFRRNFFIRFKHKRPAVFTALADIDLAHIPSDNRIDIVAFADRTIQHIQQLYMNIRYKN
jgi:hypothetical protein